jgi:DEAD/DEAH box helicase domain-containing protein
LAERAKRGHAVSFHSETPENRQQADANGVPKWEPCRRRTRQEARGFEDHEGRALKPNDPRFGRVPDILITNYSMLEYMLCRPQDANFFGDGLRALVLDEAHLYTGTLAAELTLLLRRLVERCGVAAERLLHLATSATLGREGAEGDAELRQFAATLFSKAPALVEVIRGNHKWIELPEPLPPPRPPDVTQIDQHPWLNQPTLAMDQAGTPELVTNSALAAELSEQLPLLVSQVAVAHAQQVAANQPARLLYHALGRAPLLHRLSEILWQQKRLPLASLSTQLWGSAKLAALRATISLLQMGAAARQTVNSYPLIPHRLHLLARPTDGLVVCLNAACSGEASLTLPGLGCVSAGFHDHCPACRSVTLALFRCANCGEVALAGRDTPARLWPANGNETGKLSFFRVDTASLPAAPQQHLHPQTGKRTGAGGGGLALTQIQDCPHCQTPRAEAWRPFTASTPLTLAILAETALAALPEFPALHRQYLPARGRRLLAFSDSRQEAARLGPRLTLQHETQLVRAALARVAEKSSPASAATIADIQLELADYEQRLQQAAAQPEQQRRWQKKLNELRQELSEHTAGGSLEEWQKTLEAEAILHEIIHADLANQHEAQDWPAKAQARWEENFAAVTTRLRELMGRELASPLRRAISVETLGLLEVTYPGLEQLPLPHQWLGSLPAAVRQALSDCWHALLAALCDSLRSEGAITLGTRDLDRNYQFGNLFIGRWCAEASAARGNWLLRFTGATMKQRRRWFASELLRRCGLPENRLEEASQSLLQAAFQSLHRASLPWLKTKICLVDGAVVDGLQLYFPELGLRRPAQLFQSSNTNHIWPRSVLGCAPELGCTDLQAVSHDQLDRNPRYGRQRRELRTSPVFELALWAEEHSAQLSPKQNRRLQDLFKIGARNILSSTTTLELGIDIGGLNGVLMGNVPPGKANYLQRAGRAGRRADGSSVVLTYARPRPFDRAVFNQFGDYLSRELRRPRVLLDRQRIAQRHCHAFLLGEFFRLVYPPGTRTGAMRAFGSMGNFSGAILPPRWQDKFDKPALHSLAADWQPATDQAWWQAGLQTPGLEPHFLAFLRWLARTGEPDFRPRLEALLRHTPLASIAHWQAWFVEIEAGFQTAVASWREDYQELLAAWEAATSQRQANALRYQLSALYDTTVIEALADRQFLPRYGFPIGLQKLQVIQPDEASRAGERVRIREEDQFRLERPGLLALREYVPGSQLLVGGKLVTSRGLRKHWTGAALDNYLGLTGQYAECSNRHTYYAIARALGNCPICAGPPASSPKKLLLPKHGFSSAAWDPPRRSTEVERVGRVERALLTFGNQLAPATAPPPPFAGIAGLTAHYREAGELLVFNSGAIWEENENEIPMLVSRGCGFAICLKCGYADSERKVGNGQLDLPPGFLSHAPLTAVSTNKACWENGQGQALRNQTLAAREITDVLLLTFTGPLKPFGQDEAFVRTLAQALQIAGAQRLELDTRELGVMLTGAGEHAQAWDAVIYDNVPGGAGHVRGLLDLGLEWLTAAQQVLYLNQTHHQRCETACLDCLLTFDAQEALEKGLLKRRAAHEILSRWLTPDAPGAEAAAPGGPDLNLAENAPTLSNAERLARARQPRRKPSRH